MPHSADPNQNPHHATLADEERAERDRLVEAAHGAVRRGGTADLEFGQLLRQIRDGHLYREGGHSWETFMEAEFELSGERGRQLIGLADLADILAEGGEEPLVKEAHVRALSAVPTPELQVAAVRRGRSLAETEGIRLRARHLKVAARDVLEEGTSDLLGEGGDHAPPSPSDEIKAAVRSRGGLHIVLPEGAFGDEDATAYLPGRVLVPYHDGVAESWLEEAGREGQGSGQGLTRAGHDEAAELVWAVAVPDPWAAAPAWEASGDDSATTFFPDRLGAPTAALRLATSEDAEYEDRGQCVLVAPGVDLLAPGVTNCIVRDVVAALAADPHRLYLLHTAYPERADGEDWPSNALLCVSAYDTASAEQVAEGVAGLVGAVRLALVLRDVREPLSAGVLRPFEWVLLRGKRTSQAAYESIFASARGKAIHVGREVRARHQSYPALPEVADGTDRTRRSRRAIKVLGWSEPSGGPLRPPSSTILHNSPISS